MELVFNEAAVVQRITRLVWMTFTYLTGEGHGEPRYYVSPL